ncbi:MAG: SDR family NAD(P)-dependent oxidoreductase [Candidatus Binatia bacterium]|nr:SDR family NAD(P)-dependent oxidoreductase [Candidatus Binatia bacterium]
MTSDKFAGRVAVITGGAGGIGRAMAEEFLRRGARVVLADLDRAALDRTVAELSGNGGQVAGVVTDVTSLASVRALADEVRRQFGAVHLLCNNAGVAVFGPLREASHEDWEFTMSVNFWGVVHGIEVFLPWLVEQGTGGHILNTASMAGLVGMEWLGIYCASKFAVVGLSEALYRELKPLGIGVSVLCPMIVDTRINENSARLRPAHLRTPGVEPLVPPAEAMKGGVISPAEVARRVVRGIERGDLYILTHPEQREILRRRAERLDRMFEPDLW